MYLQKILELASVARLTARVSGMLPLMVSCMLTDPEDSKTEMLLMSSMLGRVVRSARLLSCAVLTVPNIHVVLTVFDDSKYERYVMKQSKGTGSVPPIYLQKFKADAVSDHIPSIQSAGDNSDNDR